MAPFEINSFHYIQIMGTAPSAPAPHPKAEPEMHFPAQLCFFFIGFPRAKQHMHTKYIIYIEISISILIIYAYTQHNSISKHSMNMDSGR